MPLDAIKASLEAARIGFLTAIAQMNAAKGQYEAAKTRLETESEKQSLRIAELEKQLDQCGKEKKALQDGKDSGNKVGPGQSVRNPKVFMDIDIYGRRASSRIVIELFKDTTPRTAENFRALCTGEKGVARNGHPLHYKGSVFHFVYPKYYMYGGEIPAGESIYGETWSTPENFVKQFSGPGDIWMGSDGSAERHSHGYLFGISLINMSGSNGKNVVVGRVVEGMNVVWEMEKAGAKNSVIADCGELP